MWRDACPAGRARHRSAAPRRRDSRRCASTPWSVSALDHHLRAGHQFCRFAAHAAVPLTLHLGFEAALGNEKGALTAPVSRTTPCRERLCHPTAVRVLRLRIMLIMRRSYPHEMLSSSAVHAGHRASSRPHDCRLGVERSDSRHLVAKPGQLALGVVAGVSLHPPRQRLIRGRCLAAPDAPPGARTPSACMAGSAGSRPRARSAAPRPAPPPRSCREARRSIRS